jgi:hypothetical protein
MATRSFDFEDYEEWADTAERDGDELAEYFTTARD